jgi:general secretion pathway protein G
MNRPPSHLRGFTLIEMLVVLALVGVLAAAARPVLEFSVRRSQEFALREALRQIRGGLDAYKRAADEGHIARAVDDSGYPPDLDALVRGVPDIKSPNGRRLYFLRRLPRDPFAPGELPPAESWATRAADSGPEERRAGRDVFDVHSRSERRALDGSHYRDW